MDRTQKMTVCRVALVLPNLKGGGAERLSIDLGRQFLRWGYAVDFVLLQATGELLDDVPTGARLFDLRTGRLGMVVRLAGYLKREQPDAALVHLWPHTSAALIARVIARSKTRVAVCDHTPLLQAMREAGKDTWYNLLALYGSLRMTYPLAEARIAVTKGVAAHVSELSRLDMDRFSVIPNPVSERFLKQQTDSKEAENAWQGWRGYRILTAGRFIRAKNYPLLLRAFRELLRWRDAKLMMLGTGKLQEEIRRLISELGLTDKVILPGFVKNPAPYYQSADLFVLSSSREGFPLVLVEAMACGTPVVATRCSTGPEEILGGGKYGHLVPTDDSHALARAMRDTLDRPLPAALLRKRAERFSLQGIAAEYLRAMGLKAPVEYGKD